jgi:glycosyltransferase involved in cell wall biosynthesis/O-antigen/teichoic acid export membrane protein
LLTLVCALLAEPVSVFLHDPGIEGVVRATSFVFLIQALGQSSAALLKRRLAFRALQTAQVASSIVGYALIGIVAAWLGAGVWSLVAAQVGSSLLFTVLILFQAPHSMKPYFGPPRWHLARFGIKITGQNILNYGISNLDNAFVGHGFGSVALGLYSRAFNTVGSPSDAVVSTWQQVLFASCSRVENRQGTLQQAYLASLSVISLVMFPLFWSVGVCAPAVVAGLYGGRWSEAAPLLRPLAFAITLNAVMAIAGPVLSAANQVERELRVQALSLLAAIPVFAISVHYSVPMLAWGVLGVYVIRFSLVTRQVLLLLGLQWLHVLKAVGGAFFLGCVTAAVEWGVQHSLSSHSWGPLWTLVALCLSGLCIDAVLLALGSDFLLSRSLVLMLCQTSNVLPKKIAAWLKAINRRQEGRELFRAMTSESPAEKELRTGGGALLYVATQLTPRGETGVQTHFCQLQDYLHQRQIPVQLITPSRAPVLLRAIAGAVRRILGIFSKGAARSASDTMGRWLLEFQMDSKLPRNGEWTVYAQCPPSALAAMRRRHLESQQVVLVVHFNISQAEEMADRGLIERGGPIYRRVIQEEEQALLGVDRIVYVSKFMQSCLVDRIPGLAAKVSLVLPNFIKTPAMLPDGPVADIIAIGTLEPRKNQEFLLRVLARARQLGKTYTLTIIGKGEDEARLRKLAKELGIADQVNFAGFIHNASGYLWRHRIYAHAARLENLPIILIEAMAAGLPVLAAPVGGIPEVLVDGVTGYAWDLNDVGFSAGVLIRLLDDDALRQRMGTAGRERFEKHFSAEIIGPKFYEFLQPKKPAHDSGSVGT